jgi:hypothetical protein
MRACHVYFQEIEKDKGENANKKKICGEKK